MKPYQDNNIYGPCTRYKICHLHVTFPLSTHATTPRNQLQNGTLQKDIKSPQKAKHQVAL
jgi:hypothetical protein